MIAMRMVALLIAMQTTRASDMGTMIAMRMVALLIAAATQTLGLTAVQTTRASDTCNQSTYCDTVADCDAGCEECYQPEKGLAWCTTALRDGLDYNLTFTNDADMDADVSACRCGRGTGECEDLGVVKKNETRRFAGLRWNQFTYPSGDVCYDWLVVKTGSSTPPQPYFPFKACQLNNTAMARIWEDAVARETPRLTLSGNSSRYACALK